MQTTNPDPITNAGEEPDILALQEEYQRAWNLDPQASTRIAQCEDIRYNRWAGQSPDGLKHQEAMPEGERAMPYDRAPDCRVPLVDGTINSLVDVDYAAFWNARVKTAPASASIMSVAQAAEWRAVLSWMIHGPLRASLLDAVELASQVMHTIGWCVLHPVWRKTTQLRRRTLSLDAILALSQQAPPDSLAANFPALIKDPTAGEGAAQLLMQFFPTLKAAKARQVIADLRETGQAEFAAPDQVSNVPELVVLIPWQDFILPPEATADPENARVMFRRLFVNEGEVKIRAAEEQWAEEFKAGVLRTKGKYMENGSSERRDSDDNQQDMEIVYAYSRSVDEDGVPGLYCTVFSPHLTGSAPGAPQAWGNRWLVDNVHGLPPFIFLTREVTGRRPSDARGVPDVLLTAQREMKQQRDGCYVYSQLSITPPLQKKGTQASKLPPELGPLGIINNSSGDWSWFPPPPGDPKMAMILMQEIVRETKEYFGIPTLEMPPMIWQNRQQRTVMRWLGKWGEAFWQLTALAYQNLRPEELESVIGRQPLLNADTVAKHRLLLWFDVRALDPAWVESLLKNISELVLPADISGTIDRAKLVQLAMAYLDPTLAEEVTVDQAGAKQALFKEVRDELASIMQGNEAIYVENDPTAKAKLSFVQQIIGANPDYQLQLSPNSPQFNPRKRELLDKWLKNLEQSALQMQNRSIGRLGVAPGPMQLGA